MGTRPATSTRSRSARRQGGTASRQGGTASRQGGMASRGCAGRPWRRTVPALVALAAVTSPFASGTASAASTTTTTRAATHPSLTTTIRASHASTPATVATTTTTISDAAIAAKRAEADQLAASLRQEGDALERAAERINAAHLRIADLDTRLGALQTQTAATQDHIARVAQVLRAQAVNSYVRGGQAAIVSYSVGGAQPDDWARRQVYAQTVAGDQADALMQLRQLRRQLDSQQTQLAADRQDAAATLAGLEADQTAALALDQQRKATLAQVQGELAGLVQAAEARRAALEAAQVQAELEARRRAATTTTTSRPTATTTGHTVSGRPGGYPSFTAPATAQPSAGAAGPPAKGWQTAIQAAQQELGKPYEWGAAGPDSFDCSGLMVWAWAAAGVPLPHLAQDQYDMTRRVAISDLIPGDMVFYGTPSDVHHVGLYVGNGTMIEAPSTGEFVRYASIFRTDLLSGGRLPS